MPRNSSGTYSLYTPGNPVVTSTVISSTWANNSLADIATALTDSLSRSGDGGMLAPLELADGAVGAPGMTWGTESTSGWYRASAGNFRFSVSATDVLQLATTGLVAGAATGGLQGAGTINAKAFYDDGVQITNQTGANPTATIGLTAVNGSAGTFLRSDGAPALSQAIAPTWSGQHQWALSLWAPDGSAATPAYAFTSDTGKNTGMYLSGTDVLSMSSGGVQTLELSNGRCRAGDGSSAFPAWSFIADNDTGLYRSGTNDIAMSLGGTGYPIGYRGMPSRTITTSDSTAATDNGRTVLFTGAGSQTFTVDSDFGTASNIMVILNGGTGSLAIAESLSGTMTWLNGSGSLSTGSRTLAIGGIATIWMADANNAYVWGTGIS